MILPILPAESLLPGTQFDRVHVLSDLPVCRTIVAIAANKLRMKNKLPVSHFIVYPGF